MTVSVEQVFQRHAESLGNLSRAMDARSEALRLWSENKNERTLLAFTQADSEFAAAVRRELEVRIALEGGVRDFRRAGRLKLEEVLAARRA